MNLTSTKGKLLERIILDRIYLHLEEIGIIKASYPDFIHDGSCLTEFFEGVTKVIDELSMWILVIHLIKFLIVGRS